MKKINIISFKNPNFYKELEIDKIKPHNRAKLNVNIRQELAVKLKNCIPLQLIKRDIEVELQIDAIYDEQA